MDIENGLLDWLKLYTLKELKDLEGSYYSKIKNSNKYIPVKIKDARNKYLHEKGYIKKDYSIKYIRLEDIESYLWKKISIKLE